MELMPLDLERGQGLVAKILDCHMWSFPGIAWLDLYAEDRNSGQGLLKKPGKVEIL
jgi:hypothetical protein